MTRTTSPTLRIPRRLLGVLVGAALVFPGLVAAGAARTPAKGAPPPATAHALHKPPPHRPSTPNQHATRYYMAAWGVDRMKASRVASGTLIRFTYRVSDPLQAEVLRDKAATPVMVAPRTHAMLAVPVMEKIGPLRQTGALEAGREYWIAFSNKGNPVRRGDRVNVIVGRFHVEGLLVD